MPQHGGAHKRKRYGSSTSSSGIIDVNNFLNFFTFYLKSFQSKNVFKVQGNRPFSYSKKESGLNDLT